jgi:hypothetical protein
MVKLPVYGGPAYLIMMPTDRDAGMIAGAVPIAILTGFPRFWRGQTAICCAQISRFRGNSPKVGKI